MTTYLEIWEIVEMQAVQMTSRNC